MKNQLTPEDVNAIETHLAILKTISKKISIGIAAFLVVGLSIGMLLNHPPLIFGVLLALIMSIYTNYEISWKWISQLKKDLRDGHKIIEEPTIQKIKTNKTSKEAIMDNGLIVSFSEFESHTINRSLLSLNTRFVIEYTPNNKLILDIKGAD